MIKYGKWKIWADEEQWVMNDKPKTGKNGQPVVGGRNAFYYSSIESLFRGLYQQSIRDNSSDCQTLQQIVILAQRTAQELEKVLRDALEFAPALRPKNGSDGGA